MQKLFYYARHKQSRYKPKLHRLEKKLMIKQTLKWSFSNNKSTDIR
ncbi:hypothetical protein Trichorick_00729 [Candidatus Trichorickettsia mobilis]|uniref:Uncharacterized protein n=1 Tax=Candidatus Trichorickettsia mobilis TaxID=1346319 RepID=A0ABZ0US37_9RICK|nr:hypothetical protein Trichorick_00729 [Candidatus Trichorickettsia mobilis]